MLLPTTSTAALLLLIFSLIGWGSWIATHKFTTKWRYELYQYDFAWGVLLIAFTAAYTAGMWNAAELTFEDNFLLTGKTKLAAGFAAGIFGNLALMLMLGASTINRAGMVLPVTFGVGAVIEAVWAFVIRTDLNPLLLFSGALLLIGAIVAAIVASRWHEDDLYEEARAVQIEQEAQQKGRTLRRPRPGKAIGLSIAAGIALGAFYLLLGEARSEDNRLISYLAVVAIAFGVFLSTAVYVIIFTNFPIQGRSLRLADYFKGSLGSHLWGFVGGALWILSVLAALTVGDAEGPLASKPLQYALPHAAGVVGILWSVLAWHEYSGATVRIGAVLAGAAVFLICGVTLIGLSGF